MTPTTTPLMTIQSKDDPEHAALLRSFWRIPESTACLGCGTPIRRADNGKRKRFCGNTCNQRYHRAGRVDAARRAAAAHEPSRHETESRAIAALRQREGRAA